MYDPLTDLTLNSHQAVVPSYWEQHTQVSWPPTQALPQHSPIVIIGAGYTGLNTALTLAREYQQPVTLIDANRIGWGCSTRNAGFVMQSTGRLGLAHWAKIGGDQLAANVAAEHQLALTRVRQQIALAPDQCDARFGGYIKLAHKPSEVNPLFQQYQQLKRFGQNASWLDSDDVLNYTNSRHAHAGLKFNDCFSVNPLKLTAHLAQQVAAADVTMVEHCSALQLTSTTNGWRITTNQGDITAHKLAICTNAYTANRLVPALKGRSLPVLSSIITTPVLDKELIQALRLSPDYAFMDTRRLKYYYRLLPDNRLLMGGRGAITGRSAEQPQYARHLLTAAQQSFPALKACSQWEHFWSGWVSVSLDDYPRIGEIGDNLFASAGYCGAGVNFSSMAGKRLADSIMGQPLPSLPYYQSPLKPFPLAPLRRLGQWAYYHYARLRDN